MVPDDLHALVGTAGDGCGVHVLILRPCQQLARLCQSILRARQPVLGGQNTALSHCAISAGRVEGAPG